MTRVLVTGATGYLGRRVVARAAAQPGWRVVGTYLRNPGPHATERLDIRDRAATVELVRNADPDLIIHTAAGRDRDDWTANADGAANIAVAAQGRRLVHVSSDAVFSGRAGEYDEAALPDPVNRYGASKAAAETAVRAVVPDAAIVRTSLIIGHGEGGHERLTHAGAVLFTDEIRKPVHVDDLADALVELAGTGYAGVLNLAGEDAISRYDLGILVARRDGLDPSAIPAAVAGPHRPTDVRLATGRATALLRTRLRGAHEFMAAAT
ncbi:SDR family oxidoreductase [Dactylosporangium sucinum]|uniref:dTDP-4-dehydrorhamnose reductase n=1 Tax=Dactylosporangium sucinum TaxID=1424081 RepID=A0A917UD21_9ACTN|nr:SDR family oxidoreductase [Dactylosporangium sucinum]GGM84113.1 dTDP-4-dehydrorhamnose reductase [Dactylosporangium sucinum]